MLIPVSAARSHLRAAGISHVDVFAFAVVRLQHEAHVDDADAVGAHQEPIGAAGKDGAFQAWTLEFAAGDVNDDAGPVGGVRNDYWRRDFGRDFEKRFEFHLSYLVA